MGHLVWAPHRNPRRGSPGHDMRGRSTSHHPAEIPSRTDTARPGRFRGQPRSRPPAPAAAPPATPPPDPTSSAFTLRQLLRYLNRAPVTIDRAAEHDRHRLFRTVLLTRAPPHSQLHDRDPKARLAVLRLLVIVAALSSTPPATGCLSWHRQPAPAAAHHATSRSHPPDPGHPPTRYPAQPSRTPTADPAHPSPSVQRPPSRLPDNACALQLLLFSRLAGMPPLAGVGDCNFQRCNSWDKTDR